MQALWAVAAAFGCYFCMYAFRKPFTAAAFADTTLWGVGFKTVLVTAQVSGYMLSKFIGIKVISEMPPQRRAVTLLGLIVVAEIALLLFAVLPRPINALCLFANGLPLGMVFGLVLSFLEGRKLTEALAAGLCVSFIMADGVTKSVGSWLLTRGVTEEWMPSVAGVLFLLPLVGCVGMLARVAPPDAEDIALRHERHAMSSDDRWRLLRQHGVVLGPLIVMYLLVTIVRSVRADFAPEIWRGLGSPAVPSTFTRTEFWVALGVLLANGSAAFIRDNRRAFITAMATCGLGFLMLLAALIGHERELLSPDAFMIVIGLGLYLPYVAMHTTVFERFLAMTRDRGNIGFLMYVADAVGYLGYVAVMLLKNFGQASGDVLGLLRSICWITATVSLLCLLISGIWGVRWRRSS